ncbi:MAG: sce7726 family protein [Actinomycetota bacterium]|nr:sce7726 family protein [Actinomycetota bacterium]
MATEAAVRAALRDQELSSADGPTEALFEFWVPLSNERADLVVVGNAMKGYEIKTDRDSLRRLPRQAAAYGRVFDTCSIVAAERHLGAALEIIPDWWGVVAYVNHDRPLAFCEVRPASPNGTLDPETLVRLLWRDEVRAALISIGSEPDPRASRVSMWQHLLDLIELGRLREIVRTAILGRQSETARLRVRRFSSARVNS